MEIVAIGVKLALFDGAELALPGTGGCMNKVAEGVDMDADWHGFDSPNDTRTTDAYTLTVDISCKNV